MKAVASHAVKLLAPLRYVWALCFPALVVYHWLIAAAQVVYLTLHPDLPVRPEVVRFRTRLTTRAARALLVWALRLTPGTFAVEADGRDLHVHCLVAGRAERSAAVDPVCGRFETLLERIIE
ncbi:MAG: Na+/H+ antiporter subunit E [Planctomycetota bacterium]